MYLHNGFGMLVIFYVLLNRMYPRLTNIEGIEW